MRLPSSVPIVIGTPLGKRDFVATAFRERSEPHFYMNVELQLTSDGSHTLFNPSINECYHSTHGALQESLHVFIKAGLGYIADQKAEIRILEVGFGTGLNTLLAVKAAREQNLRLRYTTIEPYPLDATITTTLNYPELIADPSASEWFSRIHASGWAGKHDISSNFSLTKIDRPIQDIEMDVKSFDLVFFDAFAPQKQPEMWLPDVLSKIARWMDEGGCFVTYCAKGQVKRDLRAAGLLVESLSGPPGKREMIRATKPRTY